MTLVVTCARLYKLNTSDYMEFQPALRGNATHSEGRDPLQKKHRKCLNLECLSSIVNIVLMQERKCWEHQAHKDEITHWKYVHCVHPQIFVLALLRVLRPQFFCL